MRVACLALSLLAFGACLEDQAPAPVTTAPAGRPGFAPGELHRYAIEWSADASRERDAALPIAGGLRLRGQLAIQRIADAGPRTRLALWFGELAQARLIALGEPIEVDAAALRGHRAFVELDEQGAVARAWLEPGAPPLFRHLMGGLVNRVDLRPTAAPGGRGEARREVDERGALLSLLAGAPLAAADDPGLDARETLELRRVAVDTAAPIEVDLERAIAFDPAAAPDPREVEQALAQRFADGLTLAEVGAAVRDIDNGLLPRPGFTIRAVGLLRGWPELAAQVVALALDADSLHGRRLALDLLAAASTPESQAAMRAIVGHPAAASWPELPSLVQRFALVTRPSSATGWFVLDLHDAAAGELRRALLYPLGSLAARLQGEDPWLAALLHERLLAALDAGPAGAELVAALAGLGNAGWPADAGRILAFVDDPDDAVRLAAVSALRGQQDPDSAGALAGALQDPEPQIAALARATLQERGLLAGDDGGPRPR